MAQLLPADDFPNTPPGHSLTIGPDGTASIQGVINSGEDVDCFSFNVGTAATLTTYTTGNVDTRGVLRRITDNGSTVLVTEEGGEGNFRIVRAVEPGRYSVQVGGKITPNGAVNAYTLRVELTPGNTPGVPNIDVLEIPQGGAVSFGAIAVNTSASRTVTMRNTGTGNLQVTAIAVLGGENTPAGTVQAFRIEEGSPRTIAPGATSNFRVVFKPLMAGNFTGTVRISSNDPDENPRTFTVSGTGNAVQPPGSPEIAVGLGDRDLASGSEVSFGIIQTPSNGPVVRELVISNTGNAPLQLGNVVISPLPTADPNGTPGGIAGFDPQPEPPAGFFRVLSPPAGVVEPGRTTVLRLGAGGEVTAPAGRYIVLASFSNSDSNENPFRLLLTAEVKGDTPPPGTPEITVFAAKAELKDEGTLDLGSTHTGTPIERTITIRNTGNGELKILGIATEHTGPVIAIFPPPPTPIRVEGVEPRSVAPGASTTCRVIYPATSPGSVETLLVIRSNDADENPFTVLLKAAAEGDPIPPKEPEIAVTMEKVNLPMGGTVDFGRTSLMVPVTRTITIANKGTATLNVRAGFQSLVKANAAGNGLILPFRFSGEPFSTVAPGSSKALTIVFQPRTNGKFEAMLIITNNDRDENPYRLKLTGTGGSDPAAVPDIGLRLGDTNLALNSLIDFGTAAPGASVTKEIRISNSGAGDLKLGRISFLNSDNAAGGGVIGADGALLPPIGALAFRVLPPPNNVVPAGGSATLRIVYTAPPSGTQQVTLNIESNDPDENPWPLRLKGASSGNVPAPAEISVRAGDAELPIGGTLDFGTVAAGSFTRREITVSNSGTGELRITGFSILPVEATANDLLIFIPPNALVRVVSGPGAIAPGKSGVYVLEFMAFSDGTANFNARISSNDADENPYTFRITGVVLTPPGGGDPNNGDPADPAGNIPR